MSKKEGKLILVFAAIILLALAGISLRAAAAATPPPVLKLPANPVSGAYVQQTEGGDSFFHVTLSGVGAGFDVSDGVPYLAWCVDPHSGATTNTTLTLLSSYDPNLPDDVRLFNGSPIPWDKINWILNNKQGQPNTVVNPAIWLLITGERSLYQAGWYCPPGGACDNLASQANANGAGFVPTPGQVMAVIQHVDGIFPVKTEFQDTVIEVPVPPAPAPGLTLVKTASPTTYNQVGNVINYSYVLTNSGNVTLSAPFTVTDDKATDETCPPTPASLDPGGSITCAATYTITPADLTAGSVKNTAQGHGFWGETPVDSNFDDETVTATEPPPPPPVPPKVEIRKQAKGPDFRIVLPGSTVTYEIVVSNTGGVALTNVVVTDDTLPGCSRNIGDLAVGASFSYTCDATNVTQSFTNRVTVTGTGGSVPVSDTDTSTVYVNVLFIPFAEMPFRYEAVIGFEDLPFNDPRADYDFNDFNASIQTVFALEPGTLNLQRVDFIITPRARGGIYTHAFHMAFPANTFQSDGTVTLTLKNGSGGVLSASTQTFTAAQAYDFNVIPNSSDAFPGVLQVINAIEGTPFVASQRTAVLSFSFTTPKPVDTAVFDESKVELVHGSGLFFDPYLHVFNSGEDIHKNDDRMVSAPGVRWPWPEEAVRIDKAYTAIQGVPPNESFPDGWWNFHNTCVYGDGVKCPNP